MQITGVFPTPVGVFLSLRLTIVPPACLPHARGGVSAVGVHDVIRILSSPRPWGCFYTSGVLSFAESVFPTPVGVFL